MLALLSPSFATFLFPSNVQTVTTEGGATLKVRGTTGPPVVVSSGLFGLMPTQMYGSLLKLLEQNVTLVTSNTIRPTSREFLEDAADALRVEKLGLFAHSSLNADVFESRVLHSCVWCDPIALPSSLRPPMVDTGDISTLILKAERAYKDVANPLPDFVQPRIRGSDIEERWFENVGHACLLDDRFADYGSTMLPWVEAPREKTSSFKEWQGVVKKEARRSLRQKYREEIAERSVRHMLGTRLTLPAMNDFFAP